MRLIQEADVGFLLNLRLNQNLNQHLNQVNDDKEQQLNWLKNYKQREVRGCDYYFVIVDKELGDIGLVRVYDIDYVNKSFTWGSWIIREDNRPKYAAIESAILSFDFAFNELNLVTGKIDVRINNFVADNFYRRFGMQYKYSDELNNYFELTKTNYIQLKYNQYYKFLLN
ncbi:MAG: GNAT family N-acetyltransferase [Burkholderiales bacterium]|nr:GNAT family N-acetyltransferase [Burkholderiales bacterium]